MRREDGFTLVELMVAATLMIVIMGVTLTAFERFQINSNANQALNDSQEAARVAVDKMARELRNGAAPAKNSNLGIGRALGEDFIFQAVDDTGASGSSNVRHAQWVRYCLDASVPSDEKIYRQTYTWTGATAPAVPFGSVCPDSSVGTKQLLASHVVNSLATPATAMFGFEPALPASPTATDYAQVQHVAIDVLVNSDTKRQLKASRLTSGVYLRNQTVPPLAAFDTPTVSGSGRVYLNGSASTDPLGSKLDYLWCDTTGGAACTTANAIGQGVTMEYDAPSGTRAITLLVTSGSGETDTATQSVTVP
jgi:type II secretory pathway pseudopilin PulG